MHPDGVSAVAALHAALDSLLELELDSFADAELLQLVSNTETAVRRVTAVQHSQTAELDRRGLAHEHGCATTGVLLSQLLRLSAGEARARVKAADRLAPRRSFTGQPLPPLHPMIAAAQKAGEISPQHASLITGTIDKLPPAVDVEDTIAQIEDFLVEQARLFAPEPLGKICRHLLDTVDPDGTLTDTTTAERRRDLTIHRRANGTVTGRFEGTAELGEVLGTLLDVHATPRPAADGTPDPRTPGQRRHDGLLDAMRLALRSGDSPTAHGVLATVILTMTAEQWATEHGLATTGHGASIPVTQAKSIARGDARLFPVVLDDNDVFPVVLEENDAGPPPDLPPPVKKIFKTARPIAAYGTAQRLFTEGQRLAMTARDLGCTFPGCTAPAAWCESDHVTDWKDTARTSVDDGHLACPFHHRLKDTHDWQTTMINGIPHWIAPAWLDRSQTPQRNRIHDPLAVT